MDAISIVSITFQVKTAVFLAKRCSRLHILKLANVVYQSLTINHYQTQVYHFLVGYMTPILTRNKCRNSTGSNTNMALSSAEAQL